MSMIQTTAERMLMAQRTGELGKVKTLIGSHNIW
eukprot:CAMPEP_0170585396 /NCGR_PEP_ID=MMETSP0224-20130122/9189_1 /TAXON_ID=285029 /ORGANISM="Togula jolla, Strain CCCM 725" /LENGTH=33 /DNA_ID= /DNA_START= /DNA_END= /DNA_ORIENTATION=